MRPMFGLMKGAARLPYCGTCKTMGVLYGQGTRLLLNHDTVFLAELLLSYSEEPQWSPAYRSFNCAAMPGGARPVALDFAASAAIVLAHFKVLDHREDTGRLRWGAARRLLAPAFGRAHKRLETWDISLAAIRDQLATQREREERAISMDDVAGPTAKVTAMFFSQGARVIGRPELSEEFEVIGNRFGALIYLLDAWEDRACDAKSGEFNAFGAFPNIDGKAEILRITGELQKVLPANLGTRLQTNVEEKLGLRLRVLHGRCRKTAGSRWRDALELARVMRRKENAGLVKGGVILATVTAAAFVFPHQARTAESWRQCLGLGLNLMALGGVFAMASIPPPVHEHAAKAVENSGGCGGCTGDCCASSDCCDCCSDGCCSVCD